MRGPRGHTVEARCNQHHNQDSGNSPLEIDESAKIRLTVPLAVAGMKSMKHNRQGKHDQRSYEIIPQAYDSRIRRMNGSVQRHTRDVMKKAPKGNEGHNLELLGDKLGHRLGQNDDEQKNLIHEDKAERSIDGF